MKENKRTEYIDKVTKSYNDKIENCKDKKKILRLIKSRDERIQYFKNIKQDPFKLGRAKMLENSLKPIRARKIRFYPNREQKTVFRKWIGTYRYLYNKILNLIISGKEEPNPTNLRNKYVPKNRVSEEEKWMLEVPKEVRVEAIKEACKNLITNKKRVKEGGITHFKMKYKRKKNLRQTISIPKSAFFHSADTFKIYPKILGDQKLFRKHDTSKNDRKLFATNYDIKIMMEKPNYWTLIVPHEVSPKKNGKVENQDFPIISLDPGLRTFLTGYSPDGHFIEIGKGDITRLTRLCLLADKIRTKINNKEVKCRKRVRILRKLRKLHKKISNLKVDFHHQISNWLTNNYKIIIIPQFGTSKMVLKKHRKISARSVRAMLNWNHYEFRMRLLAKAELNGSLVIQCNESYTSKTCSNCGHLNENLGGRKKFYCPQCNISVGRDVNGARNILLRALKSE